MNKEEIRQFKSLLKQGSLRHMNIILDDKFQKSLLEIIKDYEKKDQQITQLTNNWNELEEWLKEYMRKNENWYTNELSTYDKQYYGDTYYTTNAVLMTILDKMKEIKGNI